MVLGTKVNKIEIGATECIQQSDLRMLVERKFSRKGSL